MSLTMKGYKKEERSVPKIFILIATAATTTATATTTKPTDKSLPFYCH